MHKLANLANFQTFSIDYLEILGRKQKKYIAADIGLNLARLEYSKTIF